VIGPTAAAAGHEEAGSVDIARHTRGLFGVALAACFVFTLTLATGLPRAGAQVQGREAFARAEEARTIVARFQSGDDAAVLSGVEQFFVKYPVDTDTWFLLLYRAESQRRRGQLALARPDYERALPFIEQLNNVQQRGYAFVRFRLASIHTAAGDHAAAISSLEAGLALEPQSMLHQIFLGELYRSRGDRARAVKHFQDLAATAPPRSEGRVVLDIKLEKLGAGGARPRAPVDLVATPLHSGLRFRLLPINQPDPRIALKDICLMLESKWLLACDVLPGIVLPEEDILDRDRGQYNAARLLQQIDQRYPAAARPGEFVVAIVRRDIFGPGTRYVFSLQEPGRRVGVVSSIRFVDELEAYYEPDTIATRRFGIQLLSTTASLLGFSRATRPDCPTAYPNEFSEFLLKGAALCDSEIAQRDDLLRRLGGPTAPIGAARSQEIARVYDAYRFD
jgi:predicted Zn-dependent protease